MPVRRQYGHTCSARIALQVVHLHKRSRTQSYKKMLCKPPSWNGVSRTTAHTAMTSFLPCAPLRLCGRSEDKPSFRVISHLVRLAGPTQSSIAPLPRWSLLTINYLVPNQGTFVSLSCSCVPMLLGTTMKEKSPKWIVVRSIFVVLFLKLWFCFQGVST